MPLHRQLEEEASLAAAAAARAEARRLTRLVTRERAIAAAAAAAAAAAGGEDAEAGVDGKPLTTPSPAEREASEVAVAAAYAQAAEAEAKLQEATLKAKKASAVASRNQASVAANNPRGLVHMSKDDISRRLSTQRSKNVLGAVLLPDTDTSEQSANTAGVGAGWLDGHEEEEDGDEDGSDGCDGSDGSTSIGQDSDEEKTSLPASDSEEKKKEKKRKVGKKKNKTKKTAREKAMQELPDIFSLVYMKNTFREYWETCHHNSTYYPRERMRDMSRPGYTNTSRPSTPEDMRLEEYPDHLPPSEYGLVYPFAFWKLLLLEIRLPCLYLSVDQVTQLLLLFPSQDYIRVQVFMACFSRIVDLIHLHSIFDFIFTQDERLEAYHRLGILNCWSPLHPDAKYSLDLRRWDHREVCKMLIKLAFDEPGENWLDVKYRWAKYDLCVPGWILPVTWTQADDAENPDAGPRTHGWIQFEYTSTGPGCLPNFPVRHKMMKRLLVGLKKVV